MAEMVSSAIVGEAVSLIISGITTTSKTEDKSHAAGGCVLEKLEMARIKMEAALETSEKWQITDVSLLHWRKKLKRAAHDCGDVARRCRQLSCEEDEAEQAVRQSSFPKRIAHATKSLISSFIGGNNDHCAAASATTVRRFERLADGASEFMRYVQLGGTPRQNLFFDPLITHIFAGKTVMYQGLHPGSQYHYFSIRPVGFGERGLETMLSFMYVDCKVPKNNFGLGVMLRISESTDIIGTTVKCLRLVTPHFKSTSDIVIREITQLPTQDFSYVAHVEHWNHVLMTLTRWFRPDPLCCQGYGQDVKRSCHGASDSSNGSGNKLRFPSIFPEPVCEVFLQRHISIPEYINPPGSTARNDDTSYLDNSPPLKLGILILPHDSLEDPKSASSAIEVIDTAKKHQLTHVNVHPDQLDEMLLPKAIDYLHHNAEATTYQVCWRSNHGSAHLFVEKTCTERTLRSCRARRHGRNIRSTEGLRQEEQEQQMQNWKQVTGAFLKLWVVLSSERLRSSFTAWLNQLGQN